MIFVIKKFNNRFLILRKFENGLMRVEHNFPTYEQAKHVLLSRWILEDYAYFYENIKRGKRSDFCNYSLEGRDYSKYYYNKIGWLDKFKPL